MYILQEVLVVYSESWLLTIRLTFFYIIEDMLLCEQSGIENKCKFATIHMYDSDCLIICITIYISGIKFWTDDLKCGSAVLKYYN